MSRFLKPTSAPALEQGWHLALGGQCTSGSSHARVAAAVGGAGGRGPGRGRAVVVARLVVPLLVEAEADVALQGGRGQPLLG